MTALMTNDGSGANLRPSPSIMLPEYYSARNTLALVHMDPRGDEKAEGKDKSVHFSWTSCSVMFPTIATVCFWWTITACLSSFQK